MTEVIYWPGDGFIGHESGKLTASMAMESLGRHLADSRKAFASPSEVAYAEACIEQITAAARVSFTAKPEAPMESTPKQRRGFAAMTPEKRREISRKGGASVAPENRAYARNRDLAASAGRKGGEVSRGGGRRTAGSAG